MSDQLPRPDYETMTPAQREEAADALVARVEQWARREVTGDE